jgi:hypothetical protein
MVQEMYDESLLNGELLDLQTLSVHRLQPKDMMMFIFSRDASRGEISLLLRRAGIMESTGFLAIERIYREEFSCRPH